MNKQTLSDNTILDRLYKDPQQGMVLLMEQYTGLIWHVVSLHIQNPEDIKECVNEAFTRFYFHKEKFDPKRASLAVYLTVIARNVAVSRYRKEHIRKAEPLSMDISYEDKELTIAELRADMERALEELKPGELQVIRMKYYDGMTVQEIADSLNLPYETVKKRHYRGIRKLRASFLLLLLLLALFSVCVYGALRHFHIIPPFWDWVLENREPEEGTTPDSISGIRLPDPHSIPVPDRNEMSETVTDTVDSTDGPLQVSANSLPEEIADYTIIPGVGVYTDSGETSYMLSEPVQFEYYDLMLSLDKATYINNTLFLTVHVTAKSGSLQESILHHTSTHTSYVPLHRVSFQEDSWKTSLQTTEWATDTCMENVYVFNQVTLPASCDILELKLTDDIGTETVFHMKKVTSESLASYPYQWKEYGGILAVPRLEDGSLIIGIYPINDDSEYNIVPGLIRGSFGEKGDGTVTVTCEDGTVLDGECINYSPVRPITYYEWDFGEAKPGSYTLNIPYLYEEVVLDEPISIPLNPKENMWDPSIYEIPGGSLWIKECIPVDFDTAIEKLSELFFYEPCPTLYFWQITMGYSSNDPRRSITNLYLSADMERLLVPDPTHTSERNHTSVDLRLFFSDSDTGTLEYILSGDTAYKDISSAQIYFYDRVALNYRWDQSFEIPFTVE